MDIEHRLEEVIAYSRKNMPSKPYHNFEHAQNVAGAFRKIGYLEGISETDIQLGEVSAYLHDIVHNNSPDDEKKSAEVIREVLPALGYSSEDTEKVAALTLATKFPTNPENILEKIMCDADIFYLGTEDYWNFSEELRKEWRIEEVSWKTKQIQFLESINFYTPAARHLVSIFIKEHLERLKKLKREVK